MMKHVPPSFMTALAQFYTASLTTGTLSECWNKANILPIPKKEKGSYRPISLKQSKIMEKIMLRRNKWIADPPHIRAMGFKTDSGTRDAADTLVHDLSETQTSKRKEAAAVFLDLNRLNLPTKT